MFQVTATWRAVCVIVPAAVVYAQPAAAQAPRLDANRVAVESATVASSATATKSAPPLRLRRGTFLLREKQVPANALTGLAAKAATAAGTQLEAYVQFYTLPDAKQRAALARQGVRLRQYLNAQTFAATVPAGTVAEVVALSNVRAVGGLPVADKIAPRLLAGRVGRHTANADGTLTLMLRLFADADVYGAGTELVLAHGGFVLTYVDMLHGAVVRLPKDALETVAADARVEWMEELLPGMGPLNDGARAVLAVPEVHAAPLSLDGAGVGVLVYDTGIVQTSHATFGGRVVQGEIGGSSNHSTHVAGTLGGSGAGSAGGIYRGVAYAADIVSYQLNVDFTVPGWLYTDPGDIEANYREAVELHGVELATNSIGTNVAQNNFDCAWEGDYHTTSQLIDAIAGGSIDGVRLPVVWAAGNERATGRCGYDYGTLPPPAPAKNALVVGAINSNDGTMTSFSSWGPTDDGRIKPDVVGPGCQVGGDFGVTSSVTNGGYQTLCGTSMSAPAVAGVVALLAQRHVQLWGGVLTSDVAKAVLIHTALDQGAPGPDYQFGYGVVHAARAVEFFDSGQTQFGAVADGQTVEQTVTVAPGETSLRVTLAWSDAPGAPLSAVNLVNDLDLVVLAPDGTTQAFPWTLDPANPSAPAVRTRRDGLNNVEQVEVSTRLGDTLLPGVWTVRVVGASVPSLEGQPYALSMGAPRAPAGPDALVHPPTHDFGMVNFGGGALLSGVQILNQGGAPLTVTSVVSDSLHFQLVRPPVFPLVLPPDGRLLLDVAYVPGEAGIHEATVTVTTDDPLTPTVEIALTGSTAPVLMEDFNATDGGYGASGPWEWGVSALTSAPLTTPLWGTVLSAQYGNAANWTLTSPPLDLTGFASAVLAFDQSYEIESFFDGGNVKLSVNGGPFTVITPRAGYPVAAVHAGTNPNVGIPGEPAFSGTSRGMQTVAFDVSAFVGETVRVRWHFGSDPSVTASGWYIDNVRVYDGGQGPGIVWLTPPPATIRGKEPFTVVWRTDVFGEPLQENAVYFGISSILGRSADQPGAPGTFSETLVAPNVGDTATYTYLVRAVSGFADVRSPMVLVSVTPGVTPPAVTWITPPPASVSSGGQFTVTWTVQNFGDPAVRNAVAWGVSGVLGQTPDQPGGNGTYTATVVVPVVPASGTLFYAAFADNPIAFANTVPVPVQITLP